MDKMRVTYPLTFGESLYATRSLPLPELLLLSLSHTLFGMVRTLNFTENFDVDDDADNDFCLKNCCIFGCCFLEPSCLHVDE